MSTLALPSPREMEVLLHTARTGRYLTGEQYVKDMATRGFLHDHGPQRLAAGDHYFTLSAEGSQAIHAWKAAQPKPKPPTASQRRYRAYMKVAECFESFGHYLRWNTRKAEREREARRQELIADGIIDP